MDMDSREFRNGTLLDYTKRRLQREHQARHDSLLGKTFMNRGKRILMDQVNDADEEYLKYIQ